MTRSGLGSTCQNCCYPLRRAPPHPRPRPRSRLPAPRAPESSAPKSGAICITPQCRAQQVRALRIVGWQSARFRDRMFFQHISAPRSVAAQSHGNLGFQFQGHPNLVVELAVRQTSTGFLIVIERHNNWPLFPRQPHVQHDVSIVVPFVLLPSWDGLHDL